MGQQQGRSLPPPPVPAQKVAPLPAPPPTAEPPADVQPRLPALPTGDAKACSGYQHTHIYNFSHKGMSALPDAPLLDTEAISISLNYGCVTVVPSLAQHTALKALSLVFNRVSAVGALPLSLETLDLSNNRPLGAFPVSVCTLAHLRELCLSHSSVESIPDEIRNCLHLEELRLDHNLLSVVPAAIGALGALRWLYLHNNRISALPGTIVQLRALETFETHSNRGQLARRLGATPEHTMRRLGELDLLTGVGFVADLRALINNPALADVRLVVGDTPIDAHRFMLRRCPALAALLDAAPAPRAHHDTPDGSARAPPAAAPLAEIVVAEDEEDFGALLEYLYTRRVPYPVVASDARAAAVAALAERMGLAELAAWLRGRRARDDATDARLFSADLRALLAPPAPDADFELLLADGAAVRCHRAVLAAGSDYWLCLFQSNLAESRARSMPAPADVPPALVRTVLDWLYSNAPELITSDNVVELLVAADRLRIETLRGAAQAFLLSGLELDLAPYLWALARTHRAKQLELAAFDLMRGVSLARLRQCSTWSELTADEVGLLAAR